MAKKQDVAHEYTARQLLERNGFKCTKQRVAILAYLMYAHEPRAIDEIAHAVPDVNQVTVYRMLKRFADTGLVYQTDFRSGKAFFEFQEHHHHHVVCTSCGVQEPVHLCLPHSFIDQVAAASKQFNHIAHHTLEFFGTCKRCVK